MEKAPLASRRLSDVLDRIKQFRDGASLHGPEAGEAHNAPRRDAPDGQLRLAQRVEVPMFDHALEPPQGAWVHDG